MDAYLTDSPCSFAIDRIKDFGVQIPTEIEGV